MPTRAALRHVLVADTTRWEQQAAHYVDSNARVAAWAKNAGLGFAIRYIHTVSRTSTTLISSCVSQATPSHISSSRRRASTRMLST